MKKEPNCLDPECLYVCHHRLPGGAGAITKNRRSERMNKNFIPAINKHEVSEARMNVQGTYSNHWLYTFKKRPR